MLYYRSGESRCLSSDSSKEKICHGPQGIRTPSLAKKRQRNLGMTWHAFIPTVGRVEVTDFPLPKGRLFKYIDPLDSIVLLTRRIIIYIPFLFVISAPLSEPLCSIHNSTPPSPDHLVTRPLLTATSTFKSSDSYIPSRLGPAF